MGLPKHDLVSILRARTTESAAATGILLVLIFALAVALTRLIQTWALPLFSETTSHMARIGKSMTREMPMLEIGSFHPGDPIATRLKAFCEHPEGLVCERLGGSLPQGVQLRPGTCMLYGIIDTEARRSSYRPLVRLRCGEDFQDHVLEITITGAKPEPPQSESDEK